MVIRLERRLLMLTHNFLRLNALLTHLASVPLSWRKRQVC